MTTPDMGLIPPALPNGHDPVRVLTVDDMLMGGIAIDAWLKVSRFGMTIGDDTTMFDTIPVELYFTEVQYCFGVRYGNPAIYAKSFDHQTDTRGRLWSEVLRTALAIDPSAAEFPTADIPFVCLSDLRDRKGMPLIEVGDVLGHSLSITGWKFFQRLLRSAQRAGIDIHGGAVRLDLGFEPQSNQKGEWGNLNRVASQYLAQMTGGERQVIHADEDFAITVDGQPLNTLSGSGKAVACLALRLGLGQVLTHGVFPVFIGDEIDASMDQHRTANTAAMLEALKSRLGQILLVTHKRPEADYMIELGGG